MNRTRQYRPGLSLFAAFSVACVSGFALAAEPFRLDKVHQGIVERYNGVSHMDGGALAVLMAGGGDVLLIDVREKAEFDVSHLAGAVRVDPGIWHSQFMRRFGERVSGKTVVFYCSVGERSSRLAAYVGEAVRTAGAEAVYNLEGGIFGWHSNGRALVDIGGPTRYVHPFDRRWGRLVERQDLVRYEPTDD